jgi:hypothetical protein
VRRVGERHVGQLLDQLAVHRRDLEVEARQVAVHRELGRVHLVAHRAHRPVGASACSRCSISQRELSTALPALLDQIGPGAGHAVQAQRLEFDHHVTHGRPPGLVSPRPRAQAVVARRVGQRRRAGHLQRAWPFCGRRLRVQPRQHVEHVLTLTRPAVAPLQRQFHRHQHRIQPGRGHGASTCAITRSPPGLAQQPAAQRCSGSGMSANGAPLRSAPGLRCTSGM